MYLYITISDPLVDFGDTAGDDLIQDIASVTGVGGDDALYGPIKTPVGFACECTWFTNVYVSLYYLYFKLPFGIPRISLKVTSCVISL